MSHHKNLKIEILCSKMGVVNSLLGDPVGVVDKRSSQLIEETVKAFNGQTLELLGEGGNQVLAVIDSHTGNVIKTAESLASKLILLLSFCLITVFFLLAKSYEVGEGLLSIILLFCIFCYVFNFKA